MITLLKTTDRDTAMRYQRNAARILGAATVYRFQYQSNDGNFYYEVLYNRTAGMTWDEMEKEGLL